MLKLFKKQETHHYSLYNDIISTGYSEIKNQFISKEIYQKVYKGFDTFIKQVSAQASLKQVIDDAEKDFSSAYRDEFCGAPTGYRDCTQKSGKKDQKIYFQFTAEFYSIVQSKYSHILSEFPFIKMFFDHLKYIDEQSKIILNDVIIELEKNIPNLEKTLFGKRKNLTVIIKVLKYERNGALCTSPHYDKSALTLGLHNSDEQDRFIIGPSMEEFDVTRLSVPKRQFEKGANATSTLLFPGACLKKIGLNLNPAPHAVLPATTNCRYACIAFCLVPHLDTSDIQTTILDKNKALDKLSM